MTRKIASGPALLAALILFTLLVYAVQAFMLHPWAVADDARQFLSWTSRIASPASRPGDALADYWQQTAPPLYRAILYTAAYLGVAPLLLSKLLAFPLLCASGMLAWRFAGCFTSDPNSRFLAAFCILAAIVHNDSVFSGTPRAFASPLLLLTLLGIAAQRHGLTLLGLAMLSLVYPAPAATCLGIFAFRTLHWRLPLRLDFSWKRVALLALAALLVIGPAMLFKAGLSNWGPTLRLDEVGQIMSVATYAGRSSIVGPDGNIAWICSARIGYLPTFISCKGNVDPRLLINVLLGIVPMVALSLAVRQARGRTVRPGEPNDAWMLIPYALAATLGCFILTAWFAFAFHLPARYSQPVLLLMGSLALGLWLGRVRNWVLGHAAGRSVAARLSWGVAMAAVAIALFATPKTRLVHPDDPGLLAFLSRLPPDVRIAGVEEDLDFVPALAGRAVLASPEHDIPYHTRYHRLNQEGLRDSLAMGNLGYRAALAALVERHDIDVMIFNRSFLAKGVVPESYSATIATPDSISPSLRELAPLRAASCRVVETPRWVAIFTACLRKGPISAGQVAARSRG